MKAPKFSIPKTKITLKWHCAVTTSTPTHIFIDYIEHEWLCRHVIRRDLGSGTGTKWWKILHRFDFYGNRGGGGKLPLCICTAEIASFFNHCKKALFCIRHEVTRFSAFHINQLQLCTAEERKKLLWRMSFTPGKATLREPGTSLIGGGDSKCALLDEVHSAFQSTGPCGAGLRPKRIEK